ncbi:angiogenin-4-like, partial [Scleropages formosus]|uniref:angiogenin-4-like n=1 Tax=Scleropages formosus TaxID=113540 RepID=UPI0010FACC75
LLLLLLLLLFMLGLGVSPPPLQEVKMASNCLVWFLVLVTWSLVSVEGNLKDRESRYQKFLRQHHDTKMTVSRCDSTIKKRKIYGNETTHSCKKVNTFVVSATKNQLKAVCDKAGSPYGEGLRISNQPFFVITCTLMGGSDRPPCEYRGNKSTRKIVISCENKLPVHYDEGIIPP